MAIKIITDSTSDLSPAVASQYGITVIPVYINIGEQSYLDGPDMSRQTFYEQLPSFPVFPKTSSPGAIAFAQAYEQAAAEGATQIISIHVAGAFSAIVDTARMAAQGIRSVPVTVVDSGTVSLGLGFLAMAAAQAASAGKSVAEIVTLLMEKAQRTIIFAALDTVEFLRRSGRASRIQAGLATFLHIFPVLRIHGGIVDMERIRTRHRALERLVQMAVELKPIEALAVLHTNAREKAEALVRQLENLVPGIKIWISEATPAIGSHVGPGVLGIVCVKA